MTGTKTKIRFLEPRSKLITSLIVFFSVLTVLFALIVLVTGGNPYQLKNRNNDLKAQVVEVQQKLDALQQDRELQIQKAECIDILNHDVAFTKAAFDSKFVQVLLYISQPGDQNIRDTNLLEELQILQQNNQRSIDDLAAYIEAKPTPTICPKS